MTTHNIDGQIEFAEELLDAKPEYADELSSILATLRSVKQAEPIRDQLMSAAALAVASERKGLYKGAAWVADCLLDKPHITPEQAEPVARLLEWRGPDPAPTHTTVARTYDEFPENDAWPSNVRSYWKSKAPLYAAPAAPQSGWVSVEERLPKPGTEVLSGDAEGVEVVYYSKSGVWMDWLGSDIMNVTHWMPLPAAPGREG